MPNIKDKTFGVSKAKYDPYVRKLTWYARCGYADVAAGRPFAAWYEGASREAQLNYEIGRLWYVSIKAKGEKPPRWRADVIMPTRVNALASAAVLHGGQHSIPYQRGT